MRIDTARKYCICYKLAFICNGFGVLFIIPAT